MATPPTQTKSAQLTTNRPYGIGPGGLGLTLSAPTTQKVIIVSAAVMVGTGAGGACLVSLPTGFDAVTDDKGNTYNLISWRDSNALNAPAIGAWICANAISGVTTVSLSLVLASTNVPGTSTNFNQVLCVAEYPMPDTSGVQDSSRVSQYGAFPPSVDLTVVDSVPETVTVTVPTLSNTNWSWMLIDLLFSGNNYLICFGMVDPDAPTVDVPTVDIVGYGTFTLEEHIVGGSGTDGGSFRYWDQAELAGSPPAITITCPPGTTATLFVAYSSDIGTSGDTPPDTFSITVGALPTGLTLNTVTGNISGTPTVAGLFTFTIHVVDDDANTGDQECSINVIDSSPVIPGLAPTRCPFNFDEENTISLACPTFGSTAILGVAYSNRMLQIGGISPFLYTLTSGSLPTGLILNANTGFITGTPTVIGTFTFTIQIIDANASTNAIACSIIVSGNTALAVTCPLTNTANVGTAYSGTFTGVGGTGPYTYAITSGTLPAGITLTGATLSGTPSETGTFNYTVTVTDSTMATSPTSCQIIVGPPLPPAPPIPAPSMTLACPSTLTGTVGLLYDQFMFTSGGTSPLVFTLVSGSFPPGIILDSVSHGRVYGYPTLAGSYTFSIKVVDSLGNTDTHPCTIVIS